MTSARVARATMVRASAVRRPCRNRSSSGPSTGATIANGAIVTSRYNATRLRACPVGTSKNRCPARATVTNASAAACTACSSTSPARPEAPAPPRRFQCRSRSTPPTMRSPIARSSCHRACATPERPCSGVRAPEPGRVSTSIRPVSTTSGRTGAEHTSDPRMGDTGGMTTGLTGTDVADATLSAAVDLARATAEQEAPGLVGEHVGVEVDEERLVTHLFHTLDPAYRGWRWAVTLARAPMSAEPSVEEVVLLPGEDALLAPAWVPWSERLRPGDLGVGDLLPSPADDPRLVPTMFSTDDDEEQELAFTFGLGRVRMLSFDGRLDAVERWYAGDPGPEAPIARAAPAACASCGFFVQLSGALRQAFGVCANAYAPDDGRVVAVDHGCGAHSEAVVVPAAPPPLPPLLDEHGIDVVGGPLGHEPGSVTDSDTAEPFGHS